MDAFKERVRGRAKIRIEKAMKEYEEEERQKRMGPGGLDPVEVYESLPAVRFFYSQDMSALSFLSLVGLNHLTEFNLNCRRCRSALMKRISKCYRMLLAKWIQR